MTLSRKDLTDISLHAVAGAVLGFGLPFIMPALSAAGMIFVIWYGWELAQRVAKEDGGVLVWWNPLKWSWQARLEAGIPIIFGWVVVLGGLLYDN